jgi:alpha-amylase
VVIRLDRRADIWFVPIETVSQSEEGFERTYQGSCILASFPVHLKPGVAVKLGAHLEISEL